MPCPTTPATQRGAVLFVALVFLVLLTLLALTGMSTSILQERMTGGMRNQQLSMMGAESGLRGGEEFLWQLSYVGSQPLPPCIDDSGAVACAYRPNIDGTLRSIVQAFRTEKSWVGPADGGMNYARPLDALAGDVVTAKLGEQPRILIEDLGPNVGPAPGQQLGTRDRELTSLAGRHEWYRITSRSTGGSDSVVRVVESVYSAMDLTNTGFTAEAPAP